MIIELGNVLTATTDTVPLQPYHHNVNRRFV